MATIYQKIKNSKSPLKDNGDNKKVTEGEWGPSTEVLQSKSSGERLLNPEQRDVTTYTPPTRTPEGDAAYAALTPEQRKAQDDKWIEANTKVDTQYRGDTPGTDPKTQNVTTKTTTETQDPATKEYNMGYWETLSAKNAARSESKANKKQQKRDAKNIRKYEEGSKGFFGLGKGKGKGDLTSDVVSAYESKGIQDKDRFTYDESGKITGEVEGVKGTKTEGIHGERVQTVSPEMRKSADTYGRDRFGSKLNEYNVTPGKSTKTTVEETRQEEIAGTGTPGQQDVEGEIVVKTKDDDKNLEGYNTKNKNKTPFKLKRGKLNRAGY